MKFVLFHGSYGSPEGNWFPYLKKKLETISQTVIAPQFPIEDWETVTANGPDVPLKNQKLQSWISIIEDIIDDLCSGEQLCFVGHSIGSVFILHIIERYNLQLDSAIFVCPFLSKLNKSWQIDLVNSSFYRNDFEFNKLKKLIPVSYVIYSDSDPYVDIKYPFEFAEKLSSSIILVKNGGHLNDESGFIKFPLIYDLCTTQLNPANYLEKKGIVSV